MERRGPAPIVDNRNTILGTEFLKILPEAKRLRMATGYFWANAFEVINDGMKHLTAPGAVQVILGRDTNYVTKAVVEAGIKDAKEQVVRDIRAELANLPANPATVAYLEALYQAIQSGRFKFRAYRDGVFHPKCYIFDGTGNTDYAYVGSSNFTRPGLSTNLELNMLSKDELVITPLRQWFDDLFANDKETVDLAPDMLQAIDQVPVRRRAKDPNFVSPWEMFLTVGHHFLRTVTQGSAEFLADFQEIGVYSAIHKIENFGGCIIADSVGLGKSFIGGQVLKHYHDKENLKVLCLVPAHLESQWRNLLEEDGPADDTSLKFFGMTIDGKTVDVVSQGIFNTLEEEDALAAYGKYDVILVDEAHRFRNDEANVKRVRLLKALKDNPKRTDRDAVRFVFLTATPLNNSLQDLENLVKLCTVQQRLKARALEVTAFSTYEKFLQARAAGKPLKDKEVREGEEARSIIEAILQNILLLRTREFLQSRPQGISVGGRRLEFARPNIKATEYPQDNARFERLVHRLPEDLENLFAPHITILNPRAGMILAGLYKSHLLKRLESSLYAFYRSLHNYLGSLSELEKLLQSDKTMEQVMETLRAKKNKDLEPEDEDVLDLEEEDAAVASVTDRKERLRQCEADRNVVQGILAQAFDGKGGLKNGPGQFDFDDGKVEKLKAELRQEPGRKTLIFTQYADTAQFLKDRLGKWSKSDGAMLGYTVGYSSGTENLHPTKGKVSRQDITWYFSPGSNARRWPSGEPKNPGEDEISILVATDGLSEGANLQDCHFLVNYDLPWNPTRIIQRVGRIDRISRGGEMVQNDVINLIAPDVVDAELGLIETLTRKGQKIALFLAKEHGLLRGDEELSFRTYGNEDAGTAAFQEIRKRVGLMQAGSVETLERMGKNKLLGVIADDDTATWRLDMRNVMERQQVTPEEMQAAAARFDGDLHYSLTTGAKSPGIFLYAQIWEHSRRKLREDVFLWYDLKTGDVTTRRSPASLEVDPATPGMSLEEVPGDVYAKGRDALQARLTEVLKVQQEEAGGLHTVLSAKKPPMQDRVFQWLMKLNQGLQNAKAGKGIHGTSAVPADLEAQFADLLKWFGRNNLTGSHDKALKALLGDEWTRKPYPDLHKVLFQFRTDMAERHQEYRFQSVGTNELSAKPICGGIFLA